MLLHARRRVLHTALRLRVCVQAGTLQIPASWRERIQSPSTPRLFFNLYKGCSVGAITVTAPVVGAGAGAGMDAGMTPVAEATVAFFPSPARAAQVLEVITLLVSVRRSLFGTDADRKRFLMYIMAGVCEILRGKVVR